MEREGGDGERGRCWREVIEKEREVMEREGGDGEREVRREREVMERGS